MGHPVAPPTLKRKGVLSHGLDQEYVMATDSDTCPTVKSKIKKGSSKRHNLPSVNLMI